MTATGIAFAEGELARSEYLLGGAEKIAFATDVCEAEAHASTGVLRRISAILW